MIEKGNIISNKDGLILRIKRVMGEEVEATFLSAPITRSFMIEDIRLLTTKEKQPLSIEPDYPTLIHERNEAVIAFISKPRKGPGRAKKEPTLFDLLKKAGSPEETQEILKAHNIKMDST